MCERAEGLFRIELRELYKCGVEFETCRFECKERNSITELISFPSDRPDPVRNLPCGLLPNPIYNRITNVWKIDFPAGF